MLDFSIDHFSKKIASIKNQSDEKKKQSAAKAICDLTINSPIRAVEKLDGTKLTLIRTDEDLIEDEPLHGWIIGYKEEIIYAEEFEGLGSDFESAKSKIRSGYAADAETDLAKRSPSGATGRLWYLEVIEHLKRQMKDASKRNFWQQDNVQDLEIFIEFIQRKGTLARSYKEKGGLYLTAIGKSQYTRSGSRVMSVVGNQIDDPALIESVRNNLGLSEYPVVFEGSLNSSQSMIAGSVFTVIRTEFERRASEIDNAIVAGNWIGVLEIVNDVFKDFESSLGNTAEGVVFSIGGKLYKTYSAGQSTARDPRESDEEYQNRMESEKEIREKAKIASGIGTFDEENILFKALGNFVRNEIEIKDFRDSSPERSIRKAMSYFSNLFFNMTIDDFKEKLEAALGTGEAVSFGSRDLIKIQEMAIDNARKIVGKFADVGILLPGSTGASGRRIVGIVPMAAKPLHLGHWNIIEAASKECDIVYLLVSGKPRTSDDITITGEQMGKIWMKILKNYLPDNVKLSFTASPLSATSGLISTFVNEKNIVFRVYAGEPDATRGDDIILSKAKSTAETKGGNSDNVESQIIKTMNIPPGIKQLAGFKQLQSLPAWSGLSDKERISGTLMRLLLKYEIADVFFGLLPDISVGDKERMWEILKKSQSAPLMESILRMAIREFVRR
jgi:hypothetical protein